MRKLTIKLFVKCVLLSVFTGCSLEQRRQFVSSIPFEKERWKINDAVMRWEVRPGMARDLVKRKTLVGKSCAEINELLNIYNYELCDKEFVKFELKQFYSWNDIDPVAAEFIKIYFDENQKVVKAEIAFYNTGDWRE